MAGLRLFFLLFSIFVAAFAENAFAEDRYFDGSKFDRQLQKIVDGKGKTEPIVAAAVAVMIGDRLVFQSAAGCAEFNAEGTACVREMTPTSKLRVASISKMALALGMMTLVEDGRLDLERNVSDYLGWPLLNPAYPDLPITARQLLSHTSSLVDPEQYWLAAPGDFSAFLSAQTDLYDRDHAPGEWFRYANINYGVLAAVIEKASGERFDRFMTKALFKPEGLDIGYNWSGVAKASRAAGAGLYYRDGDHFSAAVDSPAVLADPLPYFLAQEGLDRQAYLESYRPGENSTLFSPQGGLRASAVDLAKLVRLLETRASMTEPHWRFDEAAPNGETEDGFFAAFGLGSQEIIGTKKFLPGSILIGHSGEAYGLHSGAWLIKGGETKSSGEDISVAFVSTGVGDAPKEGAHPSFNLVEEQLLRLAVDAGEAAEEPQPFDETANAMRDVDRAIERAKTSGKRPLLVLGGNWCHDSRGLAKKFQTKRLSALIDENYELVWIDVGNKDRNLDVPKRFGVERIIGTPTILILSPEGALLNADSVHDWRTADSRSIDETLDYFGAYAGSRK